MAKNLVIVESPAKAKTIEGYLGKDFVVKSSYGHVRDLAKKGTAIDIENNFAPNYEVSADKKQIVAELKKLAKAADVIWLATDEDREGEAISWHLYETLDLAKKETKRITFNEITKTAVLASIEKPREINQELVNAQQARRVLDRLVGFELSPVLWRKVKPSLSAGRVQSVAVRLIVEREKEIIAFQNNSFFRVNGSFLKGNERISCELNKQFDEQKEVQNFLAQIADVDFSVQDVTMKPAVKSPTAPFTTSTLQQDMYENHSIPAKDTMKYAQKLYEDGLITYMRTDSVNLSESIKEKIKEYIINQFGEKEYQSRKFKNKISNAQEAHECIRPTNIDKTAEQLGETYTSGHIKVYNIIWKKTVASQMETAKYIDISYNITTDNSDINKYEVCFCGKKSYLVELGFLKVWKPNQELEIDKLQQFKQSIKNITDLYLQKSICKGNITKPDGLYNESSIIKWMEKEGIGRPSTYAAILDKLFSKYYISKGSNPPKTEEVIHYIYENDEITSDTEMVKFGGNEKDRYIPSNLGVRISEYLNQSIPNLMDYKFTSNMETLLDSISKKETTKEILLTDFYRDLSILLEKAKIERKEYQKLEKKDNIKNTQEGGGEGEKDNVKKSNLINNFGNIELQNARYGPALYNTETKKYISVTPFMEWTKKSIEDINDKDVKFLTSLPIKVNNELSIEYGRYGLYIKHNGKNKRLDKKIWNRIYEGCYTEPDIISNLSEPSYQKKYPKKK